jgi:hypothetical protein
MLRYVRVNQHREKQDRALQDKGDNNRKISPCERHKTTFFNKILYQQREQSQEFIIIL